MNSTKPPKLPHKLTVPQEVIEQRILLVRYQRVMLSSDLADLYQVEPRVLSQAVKRNLERFPEDFMFQLTDAEYLNLKSQFVISSWGGRRANRLYRTGRRDALECAAK